MAMSRSKNEPFNLTDKAYRAVNEAAESYTSTPTGDESSHTSGSTNSESTTTAVREFATATKSTEIPDPAPMFTDLPLDKEESEARKKEARPKKKKLDETSSTDPERKIRVPNTGIYFYEDQVARLREISYLTERSKSEIIRDAFDYYLKKVIDKQKP